MDDGDDELGVQCGETATVGRGRVSVSDSRVCGDSTVLRVLESGRA